TARGRTGRAGGTWAGRRTRPCDVSAMPLLPLRSCFSSTSLSGSPATSAALTSRCAPLAVSVTRMAARRAARSALRPARISSFTAAPPGFHDLPSVDFLHIHPDGTAAREPDLPGGLVGDAELERLGLAALDHVKRL